MDQSHVASDKYHYLLKDLYNTIQLSQFTTQLDNKVHKMKTLFVFLSDINLT